MADEKIFLKVHVDTSEIKAATRLVMRAQHGLSSLKRDVAKLERRIERALSKVAKARPRG